MTKKSISKSIRISAEVLEYVESFEGKNFNERINNLIIDCKTGKERRQKELLRLDERIEEKQVRLSKVENIIRTARGELGW